MSPIRCVPRLGDLTVEEVQDLFLTVQRIGRVIERAFHGTSLNIALQDGVDAGQSVPHVHAHILPRKPADMPKMDDVYREMDGPAGNIGQHQEEARQGSFPSVDEVQSRKPRSLEDMEKEAAWLATEMEKGTT